MKPKFKKGDKIYFDGTYGRAIWRILDVLESSWSAPGPCYLAQVIERGPRSWKKVRKAFIESVRVVDADFKLLSEAPAEWVPCKDPMASIMRMMKPLDPLNKFKLVK
jgi:hypothetical protein